MSRTLSLIRAGWESIRTTAQRGQRGDALDQLARVLTRPDVSPELATEAHRFAGELALELGRYVTARRHLRSAVALDPQHANTRYLLGRAWEEDPDGCDRRAAICFKKATALDPTNPLYRAAFGRGAARCGKVKHGAREMLAATEAAAGDLTVVRIAVNGLLETGRVDDARVVVAKARFLCPGNNELTGLGELVKFEAARHAQRKLVKAAKVEKTHTKTRDAQDAHFATDGDRVTLPFARPVGTSAGQAGAGGTVRRDAGSFPRPHLTRLPARKADR